MYKNNVPYCRCSGFDRSKKLLFFVDDNLSTLKYIEFFMDHDSDLKSYFECMTAGSGEQFLEQMEILDEAYHLPDFVLLNNMMGGISGPDACKKLKQDPKYKKIRENPKYEDVKIFISSAVSREELEGLVKDCGADGCILIPFTMDDLFELVLANTDYVKK